MRLSRLLVPFAAVLVAAPALAAEPDAGALTLQAAVDLALAHNEQLAAADATAQAAAAQADDARSNRWPRLSLEEVWSRSTNPVLVFMSKLGQERFGPADFDPAVLNRPPATNNAATRVNFSQPLFAGGRISAGIAAARAGQAAAEADRARTREQVVQQVVEAYSGAVIAAAQQEVVADALKTARAHVKLVSDLRETGMVAESDLLQAKVREAELLEQQVRVHSGLEIARAALNLVLGRDLSTPFVLPSAIEAPPARGEALDALIAEAQRKRPDLAAMVARVEAAGEMRRVARGAYLPELGVNAQYEQDRETLTGDPGHNWSVFVAAKWNVFEGGSARARVRKATEEHRAALAGHSLLRRSVELDVRRAWFELDAARQRVEIAASSAEQAQSALTVVEDRYKEGLTPLVELLGSQAALTAARTREIAARRDVLLASAALDLATGRL